MTDKFCLFLMILGFLLITTIIWGCSTVETVTPETSESSDAPAEPQKDPGIWLNSERIGTISKVAELGAKLKQISEKRSEDGEYATFENANTGAKDIASLEPPQLKDAVYLVVAPTVSLADVLKVYTAIDENAGDVYFPKTAKYKRDNSPVMPDPLLLTVMVGSNDPNFATHGLPAFDKNREFSYRAYFFEAPSGSDQTVERLLGGIEVLPNGKLAINETVLTIKTGPDGKRRVIDTGGKNVTNDPITGFAPKQHPLSVGELKSAIDKFSSATDSGRRHITVLVSGMASFQSLKPFFTLADAADLEFEIRVI